MSRLLLYKLNPKIKNKQLCFVCGGECFMDKHWYGVSIHPSCINLENSERYTYFLIFAGNIDELHRLKINIWDTRFIFQTLHGICDKSVMKNSLEKLAKLRYEKFKNLSCEITGLTDNQANLFLTKTSNRNRRLLNKSFSKWLNNIQHRITERMTIAQNTTKFMQKLEKLIKYSQNLNS